MEVLIATNRNLRNKIVFDKVGEADKKGEQ